MATGKVATSKKKKPEVIVEDCIRKLYMAAIDSICEEEEISIKKSEKALLIEDALDVFHDTIVELVNSTAGILVSAFGDDDDETSKVTGKEEIEEADYEEVDPEEEDDEEEDDDDD